MEFKRGEKIYLPCEVKPGPFPDERMVRIRINGEEWLGFVHVSMLKENIMEGKSEISAEIVDIKGNKVYVRIPGESVNRTLFLIAKSEIGRFDSFKG